jgi:hypothetical protein
MLTTEKRSSLIGRFVGDEEKKFNDIDPKVDELLHQQLVL